MRWGFGCAIKLAITVLILGWVRISASNCCCVSSGRPWMRSSSSSWLMTLNPAF